jgi:hypothetical protein
MAICANAEINGTPGFTPYGGYRHLHSVATRYGSSNLTVKQWDLTATRDFKHPALGDACGMEHMTPADLFLYCAGAIAREEQIDRIEFICSIVPNARARFPIPSVPCSTMPSHSTRIQEVPVQKSLSVLAAAGEATAKGL